MSKSEVIGRIRAHLAELFDARYGGADAVRYAKRQAFADGYIQALTDMGLLAPSEMLDIIKEERSAAGRRADVTIGAVPSTAPAADFA